VPTPREEVQAAKTLVRREVLRQVFVPAPILQARLVLYYLTDRRGFERPWISAKNAVSELEESGAIVPEKIEERTWYRLPHAQVAKVKEARERNVPAFTAWHNVRLRAGSHAEALWRRAFEAESWIVPRSVSGTKETGVRVICPRPNDGGADDTTHHEIDVLAQLPGRYSVACEVKNGASEGWGLVIGECEVERVVVCEMAMDRATRAP
jgi:hypothetical protein